MTKRKIKLIDALTGEEVERDMNADELAQQEKDEAEILVKKEKALAKIALKASAKAKLIAGEPLTADEAECVVL